LLANCTFPVYAQQLFTKIPVTSTMVYLNAPNKGVLISQVALNGTTDQNTIPTGIGLHIYNTATTTGIDAITPGLYSWSGDKWVRSNYQPDMKSNCNNTNNTTSHFVGKSDDTNDDSKKIMNSSARITKNESNNSICCDSSYYSKTCMNAHPVSTQQYNHNDTLQKRIQLQQLQIDELSKLVQILSKKQIESASN